MRRVSASTSAQDGTQDGAQDGDHDADAYLNDMADPHWRCEIATKKMVAKGGNRKAGRL
jgi:hypothetical protein